tara:strand:- start:33412 stop:33759 length:348 start_codon:yes stop_codon:yes gene_type:complete
MTDIINLDDHRKLKNPPETSSEPPDEVSKQSRREAIESMMFTLERQHSLLTEMLENDVDYLEVTVGKDSTMEFRPTSLAVILGNGSVVLTSGMSSLNSIEALALKQKMTELVFGE